MTKALSLATLALIAGAFTLSAQEKSNAAFNISGVPATTQQSTQSPTPTDYKVTRISLFKNGYGFYNFSAKVGSESAPSSAISLSKLPPAAHGTFWYDTSGKGSITHLVSHMQDKEIAIKNYSLLDLAFANPGAKVRITLNAEKEPIIGTISSIKPTGEVLPEMEDQKENFLFLKTENSLISLIPGNIQQIEFYDVEKLKTPTAKIKVPLVDFYMDSPQRGTELNISYIAHGMSWMPSYTLDISEDKEAIIKGKASIINNIMDITDAKLDLISGYPSIQFTGSNSPVTMTGDLNQFFNSLNPNQNVNTRSRMRITENRIAMPAEMEEIDSFIHSSESAPTLDVRSIQSEDLYFYPIENFSCKKDQTVTLPLFRGKIPYSHVYTWDIPYQGNNLWQRGNPTNTQADIWHCIKVTNTLPIPLTSAPIEFTSKGRIVGQNSINFIGSGADSQVKINKSMEFKTEIEEKIISQEKKRIELSKNSYQEYTEFRIEGTIHITNRRKKDSRMEITKPIQGQNVETENATITLDKAFNIRQNPNGIIKWKIELKAGETKKITYTYSYAQ